MFLNMAHALAVFDIRPAKDVHGVPRPPAVAWAGGHIRCVTPVYFRACVCPATLTLTLTLALAMQAAM